MKGLKSTTKFYFENLSTESSIGKSVEEKRLFKRRFGFGENTPTRRLLGYVIVCHVNYAVSEPCLICLTYSFRCYSHACINKSKLCSNSVFRTFCPSFPCFYQFSLSNFVDKKNCAHAWECFYSAFLVRTGVFLIDKLLFKRDKVNPIMLPFQSFAKCSPRRHPTGGFASL